MSMNSILRKAQSDVASQIEEMSLRIHPISTKDLIKGLASVALVGSALAAGIYGASMTREGSSPQSSSAQSSIDNTTSASYPLEIESVDKKVFMMSVQNADDQLKREKSSQKISDGKTLPGSEISPEKAGFDGYLANSFSKISLPLTASGNKQMPDYVQYFVSNKAMAVVEAGNSYAESLDAWNIAFTEGKSPAVKARINKDVVDSADLMSKKLFEYTQSRNATTERGYNVESIDRAMNDLLSGLKQQKSYGVKSDYVSSVRP